MTDISTTTLDCGAVLIVEPILNAASASLNWFMPGGTAADPVERDGLASMLSELLFRGAGNMTSREHSDAMDRLGIRRDSQSHTSYLRLDAVVVGRQLPDALPLLTMLVREPTLSEDSVEPVRNLCLQSLDGLEDDPRHLAMLRLRERHLPAPLNRHGYGTREGLSAVSRGDIQSAWKERAVPHGAIITVAGDVDPRALRDQFNTLLDGYEGIGLEIEPSAAPVRGTLHIEQDSAQAHLAIAWDAPPEVDPNSMVVRLATTVLGGSTSGRLFTEVRQKRSLSYAVGASYRAQRDRGHITLYAGTTPQRAQETLGVCLDEVRRMRQGVTAEEFDRAVVGLKSQLVMQGESTAARAAALGWDYHRLGRPRSLEELITALEAVTLTDVNHYLEMCPSEEFTLVCVGPEPLDPPA